MRVRSVLKVMMLIGIGFTAGYGTGTNWPTEEVRLSPELRAEVELSINEGFSSFAVAIKKALAPFTTGSGSADVQISSFAHTANAEWNTGSSEEE